jgi:hypothetical protein
MVYMNRGFPSHGRKSRFTEPIWSSQIKDTVLQSPGYRRLDDNGVEEIYSGNLSYLEFIALVKKVWEESYPTIPILPSGVNRETTALYSDSGASTSAVKEVSSAPSSSTSGLSALEEFPAIIVYSLELRKTHTTEPKPRHRQNVLSNTVTIFGQKFQNIVSFSVLTKVGTFQNNDTTTTRDDLDASVLADQIMEAFEDFMLEYTPIFKAAGAAELIYSRRLSDSEINRDGKDIHKRTVTYMLTTEKTFAIKNDRIQKIAIDARTWMAYEKSIVESLATPNYEDVSINIVDLEQTATPNY